jgi:hypothetical protein
MRWSTTTAPIHFQKLGDMTASALHDEQLAPTAPAVGSSFYAAMRILPHQQREACLSFTRFAMQATISPIVPGQAKSASRHLSTGASIDRIYQGEAPALTAWSWM